MAEVLVKWYDAKAEAFLNEHVGGAVDRAGSVTKRRAQLIIIDEGRSSTGELVNSFKVDRVSSGPRKWTVDVKATARHAMWQHEGIGPVVPVKAKVLRFKPKGSNSFVFAKRTKGFDGIKFLTEALERLDESDFTDIE